jgi:LexA-binding, inner membrane-associated putative hydrolase
VTVVSHFFWSWYFFRNRPWVWRLAYGAVLPDLPYVFLLAYYSLQLRVNGLVDLGVWDRAWRHPLIVSLHSFIPCLAFGVLLGSFALLLHFTRSNPPPWPAVRAWAVPVWVGWLSHVIIDMLTHRSDGYPVFYPLSVYRFPTPVSYWEPAFHGREFMLINDSLMMVLLIRYAVVRHRSRRRVLAAAPFFPGDGTR